MKTTKGDMLTKSETQMLSRGWFESCLKNVLLTGIDRFAMGNYSIVTGPQMELFLL